MSDGIKIQEVKEMKRIALTNAYCSAEHPDFLFPFFDFNDINNFSFPVEQ